ncbi:hypothetical protein [Streptomyces sp. BE133]|uniref:hypothetical protein n=1 Tax=Streptomyces sp. BE133 TaxID=3002523 RepID=UPI002E7900EF|nr:hypothetical protein [Streptomyces sp. BE133]MEE1811672.1 hypothetical protein [Streptomyces sp. BE133]
MVSGQVRRTVRIRDGRTSTKTLRGGGPDGDAEEFAVLDRVGRLQLPDDHLRRYGRRHRVRLPADDDHIGVRPDA